MLYSCPFCHKIHDKNFKCEKWPSYSIKNKNSDAEKIRHTRRWLNKSIEIRERDHYLCQACYRNYSRTLQTYNHEGLSVHHIIPINEDPEQAYNSSNLVTLCNVHHEMAERGDISRADLLKIAKEQNNVN